MLSYELCKKLKAAGFSQDSCESYCPHCRIAIWNVNSDYNACDCWSKKVNDYEPKIAIPTLSELIDACNNKVILFRKYTEGKIAWVADEELQIPGDYSMTDFSQYEQKHGIGSTPEEAVANLWILLNF